MDIILPVRQPLTRCNKDLVPHEIDTGNQFGHWMFNLNAGIHFHKVKVLSIVHQELERTHVGVPDILHRSHNTAAQIFPKFRSHIDRRGFFNEFLMPPLNRAFSLTQMNGIAVFVCHDLKFDVTRPLDEFFNVAVGNAKGACSLGLSCFQRGE